MSQPDVTDHRPHPALRAQERARSLCAAGKLRDAALYQINGLGHDPANAALLTEHVSVVFALAEQSHAAGDPSEAVALLDELEARLSGIIEKADPDDLLRVQEALHAVEERRTKLGSRPLEATVTPPLDLETARRVSSISQMHGGQWDWSVPTNERAAAERLAEIAAVAELVEEAEHPLDEPLRARMRNQLEGLRGAVTADETCKEVLGAEKGAEAEKDPRVSLAMLQQAEASLRGLLPTVRTLDKRRQDQVLQRLDAVSAAIDKVHAAERERRSRARWQEHLAQSSELYGEARGWAPNTPSRPSKHFQSQLTRLQKLMETTGELLRGLDDPNVRREAADRFRELNELAGHATAAQRNDYNGWALLRIQDCFGRALLHIGAVTDDEESMDDTLRDRLGEVNPALLSTEVSRAYSEVLEYFLGKLYAPGRDKGFDKKGARLHLLKRLAQSNKLSLADF